MRGIRQLALGVAFTLVACDTTTPLALPSTTGPALAGPPPTLTVDQVSYAAVAAAPLSVEQTWHFTVIATLRNNSDQVLYVDHCDGPPAYGVSADSGESAYDPVDDCLGGVPGLTLEAGAMRVDTLIMQGPNSFDGHTHVGFGVLTGPMAIAYRIGTCPGVAGCNHVEQVNSPAFTVTLAP